MILDMNVVLDILSCAEAADQYVLIQGKLAEIEDKEVRRKYIYAIDLLEDAKYIAALFPLAESGRAYRLTYKGHKLLRKLRKTKKEEGKVSVDLTITSRLAGMISENLARSRRGEALAYPEETFEALVNDYYKNR